MLNVALLMFFPVKYTYRSFACVAHVVPMKAVILSLHLFFCLPLLIFPTLAAILLIFFPTLFFDGWTYNFVQCLK